MQIWNWLGNRGFHSVVAAVLLPLSRFRMSSFSTIPSMADVDLQPDSHTQVPYGVLAQAW